jgi:copper(I)-binding protein
MRRIPGKRRERAGRPPGNWAGRCTVWRVVVCTVAGLVAFCGCGAGQVTQTASETAAVTGASADAGRSIALRNVWIPFPPDRTGGYPAGSSVPVVATIVNYGSEVDELVGVASPVAVRVLVEGATRLPPHRNVVSTDAPAEPASPLVAGALRIVLTTSQVLRTGLDTPVTFRFQNAGQVTLPVPMAVRPPGAPGGADAPGR